jgi:hypothetical protein
MCSANGLYGSEKSELRARLIKHKMVTSLQLAVRITLSSNPMTMSPFYHSVRCKLQLAAACAFAETSSWYHIHMDHNIGHVISDHVRPRG